MNYTHCKLGHRSTAHPFAATVRLLSASVPSWHSLFYGLIAVSLFVYALELVFPWRKGQPRIRRDFWIDGFYMFFNVFLFSLIGYNALSNVTAEAFTNLWTSVGLKDLVVVSVKQWPIALQLAVMFVLRDFIE